MELADETIAAAQQSGVRFRFRCGVRKGRTANSIIRSSEASMRVRGFNRRTVDDEPEQQKREHASKRTGRPDQSKISFSVHFCAGYVRVPEQQYKDAYQHCQTGFWPTSAEQNRAKVAGCVESALAVF